MKKYFSLNYAKLLGIWLFQGKWYIGTFIVIIITVFYATKILSLFPNFISLAFSIIGISMLLFQQVADARRFAIHKPNTPFNWLKSYPTGKPIIVSANILVEPATATARGIAPYIMTDDTIESKVEYLFYEVNNIHVAITGIEKRVEDVNTSLEKRSKKLNTDLQILDTSLQSLIAGHVVGDYDMNFFAIIITLCGTLIQSFT